MTQRFCLTVLLGILLLCAVEAGDVPPKGSVVLNEVVIDSRGSNPELEFFELYSKTPNFPIAGLSVLCIEGELSIPNEPPGMIVRRFDVPAGHTTNAQGFYLISNQRTSREYGVTPDLMWNDTERVPNDNMTIVLVRTDEAVPEKEVLNPYTAFPSGLWDSVALLGPGRGRLYFNAPEVGPDGQWLAAGATRIKDGVDTDSPSDWALADIEGPPQTYNTPGRPNQVPGQFMFSSRTPAPAPPPSTMIMPASPAPMKAPSQVVMQPPPVAAQTPAPVIMQPAPVRTTAPVPVVRQPTPAPQPGQVQWAPYSATAIQQALAQHGNALVYVRSAHTRRCINFEKDYLIQPNTTALLANRPLFFLNAHEPANRRFLAELGVYRVPTLVFQRRGAAREYLVFSESSSPSQIYQFLSKR